MGTSNLFSSRSLRDGAVYECPISSLPLGGEGLDFALLYQEIPEKTTGKDLTDML